MRARIKIDPSGEILWSKTYGGANDDWALSFTETVNCGYVLTGVTNSFGVGSYDIWLVKTDILGNMQWNRTLGGTNDDRAFSVIQTESGYSVTGMTQSFGAGEGDMWLIKLAQEEIFASIDIAPNSLNLKSKGEWITGYIELPECYDVADINVSSILLNDTIPAEMHPIWIEDEDGDGIPDLVVKFDRSEVILYILANVDIEDRFMTITLTITGTLNDGAPFEGSDTIKIIKPKGGPGRNCLLK